MERYKYPRTPHLPFSPGATSDDKVLPNTDHLLGETVVVTEKMDGENTTIYKDYYHARSIDSAHKSYHSWLLSYIPCMQSLLSENERICGEYLFAKHSISYSELESYFYGFSAWDGERCLSWDETQKEFERLGIVSVPIIYVGEYSDEYIRKLAEETVGQGGEGIVVRTVSGFSYNDFGLHMAKFVRPNHVQTDKHWSHGVIEKNSLKKN